MKKMGDGSKSGMGRPKPIVDPRRLMPVAPVKPVARPTPMVDPKRPRPVR